MIEMGDIYTVKDSEHEPGVYRVVGTKDEIVLIKIGDLEGNRVHTGHIVKMTTGKVQDLGEADMPTHNLKQKILSEIGMIPHVLSSNIYRMKSNKILNTVSFVALTAGILSDVLALGYPNISSAMAILGILGFVLSMSVFYNSL